MTAHAVPDADDPAAQDNRGGWLLFGLSLTAMPFLAARFIPSADLPQHLSQVRLLEEAFGWLPHSVDASQLELQLLAPNTLVYWFLLPLHWTFDAPLAGKLGVLLLLLASVALLHRLAQQRARAGLGALIAGLLLFSHPTYWGFLNFLSGVPIFYWVLARSLRDQTEERPLRELGVFSLCLLLLAWAHVFWAGFAAAIVVLDALLRRAPKRALLYVGASIPTLGALLLWSKSLAQARHDAGFDVGVRYGTPLLARFDPIWISRALFGGVADWMELAASGAVLLYLAMGALEGFKTRGRKVDFTLLGGGLLISLFAFLGPAKYLNTIFFNTRFMPYGVMLLLLALPPPRWRGVRLAFAGFALTFALFTATVWALFDQDDMSGLGDSLAAVSRPTRVLGLNFRPLSNSVRGNPFLQTFAYFQAQHGGENNFSFAEHGTGVVVYKVARKLTWSQGLEWSAKHATASDLAQFECSLVNGTPELHRSFASSSRLKPRVHEGYFRLYCH